MRVLSKILYVITALSLVPIMGGYFAYGNTRDLVFLGITALWFVSLFLMLGSKIDKKVVISSVVLGVLVLGDAIRGLQAFFGEGRDSMVAIMFTIQWILIALAVFNLFRDSRLLKSS